MIKGVINLNKYFLVLLLFISVNTFAEPPVSNAQHESNCKELMAIANATITARQDNIPISVLLTANDDVGDENEHRIVDMIIRDAYNEPLYGTPKYKQKNINEFTAKYYLGCMAMYE